MSNLLAALGRFAEPSLLILVALGDGPKHGYAIMADVERLSGTPLGPGTLYAASRAPRTMSNNRIWVQGSPGDHANCADYVNARADRQ